MVTNYTNVLCHELHEFSLIFSCQFVKPVLSLVEGFVANFSFSAQMVSLETADD